MLPQSTTCPSSGLFALAREGRLGPAYTASLWEHARTCPFCARHLPGPPGLDSAIPTAMRVEPTEDLSGARTIPPVPAATPVRPQPVPGDVFGPYRVMRRLGAGGMGGVYLAEDLNLGRLVALKVILPRFASDPSAAPRFLAEARAAAGLKHPNVVTVYHVGEQDGVPFLAMEYLEGETLSRRCSRDGPLPVADLLRVGREVCEALAAAHAKGIIHRDIKPENVWLESRGQGGGVGGQGRREDRRWEEKCGDAVSLPSSSPDPRPLPPDPCPCPWHVKVLDFGLALFTGAGDRLTESNVVVGTPQYMSPEQARCEPLDARSDLFSVGAMLYLAATGRLPFDGPSAVAVLTALAVDTPPDPRALRPELPAAVAALIMRLLAKRPEERPQSAAEAAELLAGIDPEASPAAGPARAGARRPWPALFIAVGCLALATAAIAPFALAPRPRAAVAPTTDAPPTHAARPPGPEESGGVWREGFDDSARATIPGEPTPEAGPAGTRVVRLPAGSQVSRPFGVRPPFPLHFTVRVGEDSARDHGMVSLSCGTEREWVCRVWRDHVQFLGGAVAPLSPGDPLRLAVRYELVDGRPVITCQADDRFVGMHSFSHIRSRPDRISLSANEAPVWFGDVSVSTDADALRPLGAEWAGLLSRLYAEPGPDVAADLARFAERCESSPVAAAHSLARAARGVVPPGVSLPRAVKVLTCPDPFVCRVRWSPDGKRVGAAGGGGLCRVWSTDDWSARDIPGLEWCAIYRDLSFTPDGGSVYAAGYSVNKVLRWDLATGKVTDSFPTPGRPNPVAATADGKYVYWGCDGTTWHRLDRKSGVVEEVERSDHQRAYEISLADDGRRLLSSSDGLFTLNRAVLRSIPGGHWVSVGSLSPDGKTAATVVEGDVIRLWDADARTQLRTLVPAGIVHHMAFSPDGKRLAAAAGSQAQVFDVATGKETQRLYGQRANIDGVAWSPDGKRLATASPDVRVWEVP